MDQLLRELTQVGTMKRTPENREYALEVLHDALKQAAETGLLDEIDKDLTPLRTNAFLFVNAVNDRMAEKIHKG